MKQHDTFLLFFTSPCSKYKLIYEDDGHVAYAYLRKSRKIIADVWLFNRCPTPINPEWTDLEKAPFANSAEYTLEDGHVTSPILSNDVTVVWKSKEALPVAYIYVRGDLWAVLGVNDRPGYAKFAKKDGPCARVLPYQARRTILGQCEM
jgi:hypothetical protein